MPHGEMGLNGPGIYIGLVVLAIVVLGGIAMAVDAFRRPRYHFGKFGPWGYIAFFVFYVVLAIAMAIIRFTGFGANFAGTIFLVFLGWTLLLGVIEIIYLLGVVFPDEKDRAKRAEYEQQNGIEAPAKGDRTARVSGSNTRTSAHDSGTTTTDEGYFED